MSTKTSQKPKRRGARGIKQEVIDAATSALIENMPELKRDKWSGLAAFAADFAMNVGGSVMFPVEEIIEALGKKKRRRGDGHEGSNDDGRKSPRTDRDQDDDDRRDKEDDKPENKKGCCLCLPAYFPPRRAGDRREQRHGASRNRGITPVRTFPYGPSSGAGFQGCTAPGVGDKEVYEATITPADIGKGRATTKSNRKAIRPKCDGDAACHIIGKQLGGSNSNLNMFPCSQTRTNIPMTKSENLVRWCVDNDKSTAHVTVEMHYPTGKPRQKHCCHRPKRIEYTASFTGGTGQTKACRKPHSRVYRNPEPMEECR
jgi:stringent starvation protein B